MEVNEITGVIIGAALKVHSALGPGVLESAYQACLIHELSKAGLFVQSEVELPIAYDGVRLDVGYRIDLLVEDKVIVELKACEGISSVHQAQVLSYLKLSGKPIGLIINFHELHLKNGIKRFISRNLRTSESSVSSVVERSSVVKRSSEE